MKKTEIKKTEIKKNKMKNILIMFYQDNLNGFLITTELSEKDIYDPESTLNKRFIEICEIQFDMENRMNKIKEDYLFNPDLQFRTNRIEIQLWENAKVKNENTLEMSGKYLRTLKTYHVNVDGDIIEDKAKSITAA